MRRPLIALGASLMLPLLASVALAQSAAPAKPGSVAYPANPDGTPQAGNGGAPVVTDKAACPTGTKCPDKPAPSAQADTATAGTNPGQQGGVATPSTAYPDSPVKTPAVEPSGTAPKS